MVQDENFFKGWAGAAVSGALSGGYGAAALSGLNNHLPSYNVDLGGGLTIGLKPSLSAGSQGFGIGINASATYTSGNFSFGVSSSYGYSEMNYGGNIGQINEWAGRMSGGITYSSKDLSIGLSSNSFGGTASNRTGQLSVGYGKFRFSYENDGTPFQYGGKILGGGTDGYRTAAVTIGYDDFSLGTRIFTGMREYASDSEVTESSPGYPYGCTRNKECDDYKSGVLYVGYKNQRAGIDHYKVGHAFQNVLAHTVISQQQRLSWTENYYGNRPNRFYGGTFSNNDFTNW